MTTEIPSQARRRTKLERWGVTGVGDHVRDGPTADTWNEAPTPHPGNLDVPSFLVSSQRGSAPRFASCAQACSWLLLPHARPPFVLPLCQGLPPGYCWPCHSLGEQNKCGAAYSAQKEKAFFLPFTGLNLFLIREGIQSRLSSRVNGHSWFDRWCGRTSV